MLLSYLTLLRANTGFDILVLSTNDLIGFMNDRSREFFTEVIDNPNKNSASFFKELHLGLSLEQRKLMKSYWDSVDYNLQGRLAIIRHLVPNCWLSTTSQVCHDERRVLKGKPGINDDSSYFYLFGDSYSAKFYNLKYGEYIFVSSRVNDLSGRNNIYSWVPGGSERAGTNFTLNDFGQNRFKIYSPESDRHLYISKTTCCFGAVEEKGNFWNIYEFGPFPMMIPKFDINDEIYFNGTTYIQNVE
jgi:hypothetical protein